MKSKLRKISVSGLTFNYVISHETRLKEDIGYLRITVWPFDNKSQKLIVTTRFDDPWLNFGPLISCPPEKAHEIFELRPITPAEVRKVIESAQENGWPASAKSRETLFEWDRDGQKLFPCTAS
ncbi:hypothetical protein EUZ85_13100 [Hahella sp. KA22]|uniref:hypothetical protein n=1 Tax=Hahella sp. KA22 TaxID=1628392 RepID=UPI000FDD722D|nr:hypothetical protein [Hahella sp. KA22]AZZ91613.1 hypothetical protein ENC22_10540 [Hahella sp. KA22]QAY54983.1 hypothetical protein EUZ85_13100 [Hahella sp. KA22]